MLNAVHLLSILPFTSLLLQTDPFVTNSMRELIPPLLNKNSCFHPWGEFTSKVVDRNVGCRHAWNAYTKSAINMSNVPTDKERGIALTVVGSVPWMNNAPDRAVQIDNLD